MACQEEKAPGEARADNLLSEGSDEAGKLPARIDRYSEARKRARVMIAHLEQHLPHVPHVSHRPHQQPMQRELQELRSCGNYLLFRHYFTVGKVRLAAMRSCRLHLLCPLCAILRASKTLRAYLDRFRVLTDADGDLRPFLVTFTVRNGDDLEERMGHLRGAYQRLANRRRLWLKGTRRATWTEAVRAEGAVWTYEVTNRGRGWHPHIHAVWLCRTAPDMRALRAEWEAITGDSHQVDVRPIDQADPAAGFCEVFKYALKFGDLSPADNLEAYRTLKGRRLVGSWGVFRGVQVPPELTDELLDDLPYIELLYRYRSGTGYTLCTASDPVNPATAGSAEG